ncbi:MAG: hypothetical protein ABIG96_00680 [Candidatus Micrarchaeota archaeon]
MKSRINLFVMGLALFSLAAVLYADFAETAVFFFVPVSYSFTVTLPGPGTWSSNTTQPPTAWTADIYFNSTVATNMTNLEPCVAPGTSCQGADGIFRYDNTGTVPINIYLMFNTSLPSGVEVFMNSSIAGAGNGGAANANLLPLNSSIWIPVVTALSYEGTNTSDAFLFANFTAYTGTNIRYLVHNSTA